MSMILIGLIIIVLAGLFIAGAAASTGAGQGGEVKQNMSLKKAYLYLVSVISLVIAVVGAIMLLNMALKTWVFPKADRDYYSYVPCEQQVPDGKGVPCDEATLARQREEAEERRSAARQRDAAQALAMLIVASPVWWYHWTQARKEA